MKLPIVAYIQQRPTLFKSLLVVLILFLALSVRLWKVEYVPNATDGDELAYIFAGQTLIEYGVPISWSSHEQYEYDWVNLSMHSEAVNEEMSFGLIRPWLDHSFLLPVLIGGWSELGGYEFGTIPPALWYRLPMVFFSIVTLSLAFLIAREVFGFWPAVGTLTLLSFSPSFIIIQRMVVSENMIIMFSLLAIYFYLKKQSLTLVILASVLACLIKPTGLAVVLLIGLDMIFTKQWKTLMIYLVASVATFASIFALYVWSINPTDTVSALLSQSHRLIGWSNPTFLFSHPGFQNRLMLDFSYYLILLAGVFILGRQTQKHERLIALGTLIMLVTVWTTSAEQDMLGWYKIPLFTFLGISAAKVLKDKNYVLLIVLLLITLVANLGLVRYPTHPLPESIILRSVVGTLLLFIAWLIYNAHAKRIALTTLTICFIAYALQSFYISHFYFSATCRDRICPTPSVTSVQAAKELVSRQFIHSFQK